MSSVNGPSRQILVEALASVGYTEDHFEFDWPYLDHSALSTGGPTSSPQRLEVISFHDERRHDWQTTAVAADLHFEPRSGESQDGIRRVRELHEATASPAVVLANDRQADLWIKCWDVPTRIGGIGLTPQNLSRAFREHRVHVERQALARLRRGQQYLFDRVYDARRDQLAEFLHVGLEHAVRTLRRRMRGRTKAEKELIEESLSHVAMALLAGRIFEDKDFFGPNRPQSNDARRLLGLAESESNGFFRRVIENDLAALDNRLGSACVDDILPVILAHLTGPACFSLITPDMLGDLYERALVANGRRGGSVNIKGIHYTPLSLAKHILRRIPIEEVPPSRRYVADLACGSGSFLLAATARLRDAFDANEADAEDTVVDHLRSRVFGNDQDDIALLVARMRYLLTHWVENRTPIDVPTPRLVKRDGLQISSHELNDVTPTVVVGNPPFHPSGNDQMANRFLRKAIELLAPGGFLGMIMPAGFLKMRRQRCPETRRQLLDSCKLLEVWEMPERTVGLVAEQAACAIIAQKSDTVRWPDHPVVFKVGYSRQAESVRANREHLRSTWTFVAFGPPKRETTSWADDPMNRIIASPVDHIWRKLDLSRTVGGLCGESIGQGINAIGRNAKFADSMRPGYEPYLQHQESLIPFFLKAEDWRTEEDSRGAYVSPESGLWPKRRLWPLYRGQKLMMRGRTNRNARQQTVAAYDSSGIFPENDFRCLSIPRSSSHLPDWARELVAANSKKELLVWLTGIINSPIGQAWIAMSSTPRGILEEVLRTLPLPIAFDVRIPRLLEETKTLDRPTNLDERPIWAMWSDRPANHPGRDFQTLCGQINCLLFRSYGLAAGDFDVLQKYLDGMTNPWVNAPPEAHIPKRPERRIAGTVVSVDVLAQTVFLDLPRYSRETAGPIEVALPEDMPGWALREGVGFTCLAPKDRRDANEFRDNPWLLRDFRPLPYTYLSADQLDELVTHNPG